MIEIKNFKQVVEKLEFKPTTAENLLYEKEFPQYNCVLKVDFDKQKLIYPEDKGFKVNDTTTCNFQHPENFVVFECVNRLLTKGYRPEHLELEKRWNLGHDAKGGKADICVYDKNGADMLCIIECKTDGAEYNKGFNNIKADGGQLFSYWQQERNSKWLLLYASNFSSGEISYKTESINCSDDANILELSKKDISVKVYQSAYRVNELFEVWSETYEQKLCGDVVFGADTQAYNVGEKPRHKKDLIDFSADNRIVNKFEEILRHNNVSDKENAFNRLIALFICKLVDETNKCDDEIVEFQYKSGTDTYESLQDRLQKLHQQGMDEFMEEKIFYVADDYAENLVKTYTGHKRVKMIEELKRTLRILKFYTNNDFAFKDVHNEELFYQNGKVLVEVVQLFQNYRIIHSKSLQLLGDLFEQLLNKGFKQNEGQFFTPIPITRFIWDSLPLLNIIHREDKIEFPRIIDYACGAGHFLTEGYEAINANIKKIDSAAGLDREWAEQSLFGIEKDYRLARVSKISLFMHGAGDGNIIFGDGLENYPEKGIEPESFDILVANPPYSVSSFKPHLKLKENNLKILEKISNNGSEIETLFVERITQLVKPQGLAAVILPNGILLKEGNSFTSAREFILKGFNIKAIVQFGSKTFGATGTNTVVLFLEKFAEPPKRVDLVLDSVESIFEERNLDDWEDRDIAEEYIEKINIPFEDYKELISGEKDYHEWKDSEYIARYVEAFENSQELNAKKRQKNFISQSASEQQKWFNTKFYEYVHGIEKEKLLFFALTYTQRTLIVNAPDDNKEQEKFLGYRWSNRKGSEGIQVFAPGGMLYNDASRDDEQSLSGLIRNMFLNIEKELPEFEKYYYYMRTVDMLDFNNVMFSKVIKPMRPRVRKNIAGWKSYNLSSNIFDTSIGDRMIVEDLSAETGIPVYSANVFDTIGYTNKEKLANFSMDSIIWGIDGDWMVNVIPAGRPFFPTDHCGVLRINSDKILPKFMAIALEAEGNYEGFSRNKRASTQRIRNLAIMVPTLDEQKKIIDQFVAVENEIMSEQEKADLVSKTLKDKFTDMFGDPIANNKGFPMQKIDDIIHFQGGAQPDKKYFEYEESEDNVRLIQIRDYKTDAYITYIPKAMARKVCEADDIMIGRYGPPIFQILKGLKGAYNVALIKAIPKKGNKEFVRGFLSQDCLFHYIDGLSQRTAGQTGIDMVKLKEYPMPFPPSELQDEYAKIAKEMDKNINVALNNVKLNTNKRVDLLKKYFA